MVTQNFRQFGSNFLGPLAVYFCEQLSQQKVPFYFLAREGYFLHNIYNRYQQALGMPDNGQYLLASRSFMFRLLLDDERSYEFSLKGEFTGTFYELLRSRFMISNSTIQRHFDQKVQTTIISLPDDDSKVRQLLLSQAKHLAEIVAPTKTAYLAYLNSLGLNAPSVLHIVDLGYSGTIQKLMSLLLEKPVTGHYLISSKPGMTTFHGQENIMKGYLKQSVTMGDGYVPLDRSMFLEALLTSPNGQFQDVRLSELPGRDFDFYYGRKVNAQKHIHELEQVMAGVVDYVVHAAKHNIGFSQEEVESSLIQHMVKPHMIPRALWHLFAIDDDVAGNGTVDPLQFFGLR
ncbi:HAD family hydrolase [Agarivorans sp. MS3-6]